MNRPLISVIIATARNSYGSLSAKPNEHLMLGTFKSLEAQTMTDFEVIVVDSLYKSRNLIAEIQSLGKWSFKWSVTHPKSWWLDRGMWALQAAFNAGAVSSRGEHLMFCGDCGRFDCNAFERSAILLDRGLEPHFTCFRTVLGEILDFRTNPPTPIKGAFSIQNILNTEYWNQASMLSDTRLFSGPMAQNGVVLPQQAPWQWFYGYGFIGRSDFFAVNGWSELYDGDKALGDVEMGSRLEQSGRLKFYMERTLCVYEESHNPTSILIPTFRSNYDLIWLHRFLEITKANSFRFSDYDLWRVVKATITGLESWPFRSGELSANLEELRKNWMENQPVFELDDHCAGSA